MGYYNDVALVLDTNAQGELRQRLFNTTEEICELFHEGCDYHRTDHETGIAVYVWEYSKWLAEEELFITELVNSLGDEHYHYLRVGETTGDIEEQGELEGNRFNVRISTVIEWDRDPSANKSKTGE